MDDDNAQDDEPMPRYKPVPTEYLYVPRADAPKRRRGVENYNEYTDDEVEFLKAIMALKEDVGPHPTDAQVLRMFKALGYRKIF